MNRAALAGRLRRTYLQIDLRSLALGRIVLGLVLIGDLLRRIPDLRDLYSNLGLIPNHTVLWRPPFPRIFSVFFMASLPEEAAIWFFIAFIFFFCFLVGYRTRLFHLLSFAMTTSLHNRVLQAENWGGVAIGVLMIWTAFLPLGRRFSVDALRASLRARPDETPADLAAGVPGPDERQTTSLAALGLLLQIAAIYWLNFVHKSGPTWRDGSAVHYVLWQERIVTWVGLQVREHAPYAFTKLLTEGTLVIEASAAFLVLTPIFWRWTRFIAALLLVGLHCGIALLVDLGIFSFAMLAFQPFLLTDAQWALFSRLVPRRGRARTVFYDVDCGVCWAVVRVLARMDVHHRLRWVPNSDLGALPAGVAPELLDRTMLVVDPATDRRWTRAAAFAEIFGALPLGRLWAWPMRLPGLRALADRAYDAFARNRTTVSGWFGLAACGVKTAPGIATGATESAEPVTPLRARFREQTPFFRELGVAVVFVVLAAEVSIANPSVPRALRFDHRPEWMVAAIMYPHIFEGWSLFSPDAPLTDETIYVDAVTRDGRHVDPYNQVVSRVADIPIDRVPVRLAQSSFWCDFTLRIPDAGVFHQAFIEWILRYPDRTGNPKDAITRFDAYVVEQRSPGPGEVEPTDIHQRRFLQWP
ncbi:MAG TPA: DCC1-like thiol-disulfide oxidoreductase family protein [Polyangia bacterium]|nr:DCC1-like thiol-disulfide oxidoreductase family protein [Polyangia bacterium]